MVWYVGILKVLGGFSVNSWELLVGIMGCGRRA